MFDIGFNAETPHTSDLFAEFSQIAEEAKCGFHMDSSGQVQTPEPQADQSPKNTAI